MKREHDVRFFQEKAYKDWRLKVYQRDRFTCRKCGKRERRAKLQAHHIRTWAAAPELRYALDNGITLCKSCHDEMYEKEDDYAALCLQLLRGPDDNINVRQIMRKHGEVL